jgi:hypothetical protein
VREAAVARLDVLDSGRELPFLLIRLNDWVGQVAERSRIAIERRLAAGNAASFLDNLPILFRLVDRKRREHADVLTRVYELLRAPEHEDVRRRGLVSPARAIRRATFRLAREAAGADGGSLLRLALRDTDTVIRLEAAVNARERLSTEDLTPVLPAMIDDRYPRVRREALAAAAERLGDGANAWLLAAIMDRNQVVREVARFFLRRRGMVNDFAALYREGSRAVSGRVTLR